MALPKTDREKEKDNDLVFSYLTLRNLIGICGILLPVVLMLFTKHAGGKWFVEPSISNYYYTNTGDFLVFLLSVLGIFLLTYNGYVWRERIWTMISAAGAIGVAFFPMGIACDNTGECLDIYSIHRWKYAGDVIWSKLHFISAGLFFFFSALICLRYFPKGTTPTKIGNHLTKKGKRNIIYKICGWIMMACVAALIVYMVLPRGFYPDLPVIFILEAIAVEAFGIAWLTKGQTLLPDGEHYITKTIREAKTTLQ
jgi:hypothetical protein